MHNLCDMLRMDRVNIIVFLMFFFFNDTATTEIYTLSLHDALPIWVVSRSPSARSKSGGSFASAPPRSFTPARSNTPPRVRDRKSTRLNSSHANISYAVFCLKKKKIIPLPSASRPHTHHPLILTQQT